MAPQSAASTVGMRPKSRLSPLNLVSQPKLPSTTPAPWQQHKAFLGVGQLDHLDLDALFFRVLLCLLARVFV